MDFLRSAIVLGNSKLWDGLNDPFGDVLLSFLNCLCCEKFKAFYDAYNTNRFTIADFQINTINPTHKLSFQLK